MERLFSEFCPLFPRRSASARSDDSRSHPPPPEIIEQTPEEWGLCPDSMDRRQHRPRDIEIYDFRIPFYIFTVLIDLRDRLRWQFSRLDTVPEAFSARTPNKPMSRARAEATVTKVMERMRPFGQRFPDNDPYSIKGRQLASYVSTTTRMKIRLPYELCDIILSTGPEGLLINGIMVKREVVEAILQCRLHDEGKFINGIVFETNEVKKEKEMLKGREYLTTLDVKLSKDLPQNRTMRSPILRSATGSASNTVSTSDSDSTATPAAGASSLTSEGSEIPQEVVSPRRPQCPTISYTRSSCGKILEVDTASPTRRRHSRRRDSMSARPFMGYEPAAIAELAENYCRTEYNLPVIIDESLVRLLFGMPERGRTFKVGGESGWGKYGKDVKMQFDYFLE
ncbi:hypothetical protein PVAR5_0943 [Paecilomyces variotii No. 5]|uniref:Uncharacterized protein n=1 Tax=Byssochlamys spectabilis (strain No. 5 / NBRC 109023) TaxID=1356009 RepID=V5FUT6_BYSSN|nr:hypothetical protein PVAR5_0943 [Paecilomyces variotii No. 5]